jgi:hypothetical protein
MSLFVADFEYSNMAKLFFFKKKKDFKILLEKKRSYSATSVNETQVCFFLPGGGGE